MSKAKGTHSFDLLFATKLDRALPPVVVAFGADAFLRRQTIHHLLKLSEIDEENAKSFDGESAVWRDVHDELATVSLFDPDERRVAIVKHADDLVKSSRAQLEKWCKSPVESSLMLLELSSFSSNTILYKIVAEKGWCIDCSAPKGKAIEGWIKQWLPARTTDADTTPDGFILDRVGPECGLLDQELAKAALYADDKGKISDEALKQAIGSWRTQTVWEIVGRSHRRSHARRRSSNCTKWCKPENHRWPSHRKCLGASDALAWQRTWWLKPSEPNANFRCATHWRNPASDPTNSAPPKLNCVASVALGIAHARVVTRSRPETQRLHSKDDRGVFAIEELIVRLAQE